MQGQTGLDSLHLGTLQPWIEHRRREGKATGTINHGLKIVGRILNLAASEWVDELGLTWLLADPKSSCFPTSTSGHPIRSAGRSRGDCSRSFPTTWHRWHCFAVNTGCRDQEICSLRWEWEVAVPQVATSVFIIPAPLVKNGDERLVVLNRLATSVVEARRGISLTHVFTYKDKPITRMLTSGWKRARSRAELPQVRVHDLKHTFGRRLRAAGVSFEDRQDLLGHHSGRITTHYSAAELPRLIVAANSVCERDTVHAELVVLRGAIQLASAKLTQPVLSGLRGTGKSLKLVAIPTGDHYRGLTST